MADIEPKLLRAAPAPLIGRDMPESLTDDPRPRGLTQRVGGLFAALGVVGALMVALPLAQLLRYQVSEASALTTAQARLDPMAQAVGVQRALLAHRDVAALVLAGHDRYEPERHMRQRAVNERLSALVASLTSGHWQRAVNEAEALGRDWDSLARSCARRSLAASQSHESHRLLIEQTLQVMDMVIGEGVPELPGLQHQPTLAVVHALPRLAWKQAQIHEAELAAQAGPAGQTGQKGAAGERALPTSTAQRTAGAALDAQLAHYQQAYAEAAQHLDAQRRALQSDSGGLIIAMLALAGVAMLLTRAALPGLRQLAGDLQSAGPPAGPGPSMLPASRPQDQAGVLLGRLRVSRPGRRRDDGPDQETSHRSGEYTADRLTDRTKRDPQTTLPPPP